MITFGANLKVNDNIYDKLTTDEAKESVRETVEGYKKFIEIPKIEELTKEDTIEIRRAKHRGGYAIELEITNPNSEEPFVTGVYTNKKDPDIRPGSLIHQTLLYLCLKTGEQPRFLEGSFRYIDRVLFHGKMGW